MTNETRALFEQAMAHLINAKKLLDMVNAAAGNEVLNVNYSGYKSTLRIQLHSHEDLGVITDNIKAYVQGEKWIELYGKLDGGVKVFALVPKEEDEEE